MKVFDRPLWVAVCLLLTMWTGFSASAQFLPTSIISAPAITAQMKQTISSKVGPEIAKLESEDSAEITEARSTLVRVLQDPGATPGFQDALSDVITQQLTPALTHNSDHVRLNAAILLASMTDAGSMSMIQTALSDKNVGVQRWAALALGKRVELWRKRNQNSTTLPPQVLADITAVVKQLKTTLEQVPAPHPVVAGAALQSLMVIDTSDARKALVEQLNNRVALHAVEPGLPYSGELIVVERFASNLSLSRPFDVASATQLNRAVYRMSRVILEHTRQKAYNESQAKLAHSMLLQCVQALSSTSAGAGLNSPPNQALAKSWVINSQWNEFNSLIEDQWPPILTGAPFRLTAQDLAVKSE